MKHYIAWAVWFSAREVVSWHGFASSPEAAMEKVYEKAHNDSPDGGQVFELKSTDSYEDVEVTYCPYSFGQQKFNLS